MLNKKTLSSFIEYGVKAPSGHNTQPWKFLVGDNAIKVIPDLTRNLPIADSDNHSLYISLGCAIENIIIAASNYGFSTEVEYISENNYNYINLFFNENPKINKDVLINYIPLRQSTRNAYKPVEIPNSDIEELRSSSIYEDVSIMLINTKSGIESIIPFIIEAINIQFNNKDFVNELVKWIRFSEKEAIKTKDGLWAASMGLPNMGKLLGKIIMKYFVGAKSECKRLIDLLHNTSAIALFVAEKNNPVNWISLGRTFQRFGLIAAKLNIRNSHINMPCEEIEVRNRLAEHLKIINKHPLLMVRLGYSEKMPYSFRRSLSDVIEYDI